MKKLSIIIPVYNASNEIEKCIDSIINQTYKDYEIICINDGSTDNSLDVLNEISKKYKCVIVYDQKNSGVSVTRNNGVKYSNSDYIMFVDNDDYFDSNTFLEEYMKNVTNNEYDIVIGSYTRKNENGKVLFKQKINTNSLWTKYLEVTPWARIYNREFLINNNICFKSMPIGEDIYFNFLAYENTDKIKYISNFDYIWYFNSSSVSNTKQRGLNDSIDIIKFLEDLKSIKKNEDELFKYFVYRYTVWYLIFSGRYASSERFNKEYLRIQDWLKKNNYQKVLSPFSFKIKGDDLKNRCAVLVFKIIDKFKCYKLFSKIFCKGSE